MCELGAGWGRWITNAVAALRKLGNLPYTLVAVEAEPTHFQWLIQHLKHNDVSLDACWLVEAAVTGRDGKVGFYTGDTAYGGPDNWYGQFVGGPTEVKSVSLDTILRPLDTVDLLDMDVQGLEFEVLEAATGELQLKVKRIHIETHNEDVEHKLTSLFTELKWKNVNAYPCNSASETPWGRITFQGGVQTWINPRLSAPEHHDSMDDIMPASPIKSVAARTMNRKRKTNWWDRSARARRPAITDDGFDMPGFAGHYYMWPEEYGLLSKYVDLTQGDYLEIGSMCGIIAMSFAVKYPQRKFFCVDAFCPGHATIAGNKQAFLRNLQDHDLKNITLIEEDSRTAVPKISHRFDIALIDANHAYEYVLADALNTWPLLAPGGYMVFHDYGCVEETTRAVEEFLSQTGARLVEAASCLAVVCKSDQPKSAAEEALSGEIDELQEQVAALQRQVAGLSQEKRDLETVWQSVQGSAGWRLLNRWRKVREQLAPPNSLRRKFYDLVLGSSRRH
jgi:FkbM family methyltransferase